MLTPTAAFFYLGTVTLGAGFWHRARMVRMERNEPGSWEPIKTFLDQMLYIAWVCLFVWAGWELIDKFRWFLKITGAWW